MRATSAGTKRKLPKRAGKLIKGAATGLEQSGDKIADALVKEAEKGNISSTKLLLELAEHETEEPDDAPPVPIEKTGWGKTAAEPPYQGPGPSERKTEKIEGEKTAIS